MRKKVTAKHRAASGKTSRKPAGQAKKTAARGKRPVKKRAPKRTTLAKTVKPRREKPADEIVSPAVARTIWVLSDSTGNLAKHMLTAFLTQFPQGSFTVKTALFLRNEADLMQAFEQMRQSPGIVFHAVVSREAKERIEGFCRERDMPCSDLTGGFLDFLARSSGVEPLSDWRRLHRVDEAYQRRIEAVEFVMTHDDGLGLETLQDADIVLTGVSRTSKTPTSIYLAQQGFKVGNVALANAIDPPRELLALTKKKVVGLVIDASQLSEIRTRRQTEWNMPTTRYNQRESVEEEIRWSRRLFQRQGWHVLDVTDRAIEETAARVLQLLGLSHASTGSGT